MHCQVSSKNSLGKEGILSLWKYYDLYGHTLQVYDVTNERSFENVCSRWAQEVDRFAVDTITKVIVGNKADLEKYNRSNLT